MRGTAGIPKNTPPKLPVLTSSPSEIAARLRSEELRKQQEHADALKRQHRPPTSISRLPA
jgi:hypothetical protein